MVAWRANLKYTDQFIKSYHLHISAETIRDQFMQLSQNTIETSFLILEAIGVEDGGISREGCSKPFRIYKGLIQ
jgi:hypothetical protein